MRNLDIAGKIVGPGQPCFVIAEAGVNHNGDMVLAEKLIDAAAAAGADAVKFQTFRADRLVSKTAPKADYQLQTTDRNESQQAMLKRLELPYEAHRRLQEHCRRCGILFMSTAFDEESADFLAGVRVPVLKVPSGEVTNWLLLRHVARLGLPIILSTGMSYLGEVDEAVRVLAEAGCRQLALLHCLTNYPAAPAEANLRAMATMQEALQVPAGYSDHTPGLAITFAAVALGACIIEKHFTLDRNLPGPDHRASLEPGELKELVVGIRSVESALGSGIKRPAESEARNREIVRRSLAAACDLNEGAVLEEKHLITLRPAGGIAPRFMEQILGRRLKRTVRAGEILTWKELA